MLVRPDGYGPSAAFSQLPEAGPAGTLACRGRGPWVFEWRGDGDVGPYQTLGCAAAAVSLVVRRHGDRSRRHRLGGRQSDALAWPARPAGAWAAGISSGVGLRRVDLRTLVADLRGNRRCEGLSAGQLARGRAQPARCFFGAGHATAGELSGDQRLDGNR